uniref:Protein-tyrosine sulfotransferase n=1 Tax=Clastoptera arizonana TaxID=38151 RepID=A0A1B6DNH9_9HEMI
MSFEKITVKNDVGRMGRGGRKLGLMLIALACFVFLFYKLRVCNIEDRGPIMVPKKNYIVGSEKQIFQYDRDMPLIFIGGVPRSGTTLMRAMLDAHPDVRCGQETRVIPRILQMRQHWLKSKKESMRLEEAGVHSDVLDAAVAAFCLEVIARHGEAAPRLCNKDPLTLKSAEYLSTLFPQAKFIFMVRDGRATVHSIISRKVTITGFDLSSHRQCMQRWNNAISTMYYQCQLVGQNRCMLVYYEQLVLHPAHWMRRILKFLDVPWNESVLHHEDQINKPGGVILSKVERSSDQVIKPVNVEALTKWVGNFPSDVVKDMADLAPMLNKLGYDPEANPPNYGSPDAFVADNTRKIRDQVSYWEKKASNLNLPIEDLGTTTLPDA